MMNLEPLPFSNLGFITLREIYENDFEVELDIVGRVIGEANFLNLNFWLALSNSLVL